MTAGLKVFLVNLNVHAQNIALKPTELLHLLLNYRGSNRTTGCITTRAGISHE